LIEELYLNERTEAELAHELGVSQRAVNKRKHVALARIRQSLDGTGAQSTMRPLPNSTRLGSNRQTTTRLPA
jgi:hypothetical protein